VIFDPKIGALYADDGTFIKTVYCPMALRVSDLATLPDESPDRHCHSCHKTIRCLDDMDDIGVRKAVEEDSSVCVFATAAAKNIVFLQPIGQHAWDVDGLLVIKTARSLPAMVDAQARGYRLVIRRTEQSGRVGSKYIVFQHNVTGELWWSGDFRSRSPDRGSEGEWRLVADWFYHRPDMPFPLAAYLVPQGLKAGQRVLLEDLIEDVGSEYWNQGDSRRLLSSAAVWRGDDFELDLGSAAIPRMVG
jgi:hypothetical protein